MPQDKAAACRGTSARKLISPDRVGEQTVPRQAHCSPAATQPHGSSDFMSDPVSSIRVDRVTKDYRIYSTPIDRFRDALGWRSSFKEFSALSDVSLSVSSGEFWGIVGKNGSGKSTLLKIVARQLQATSGSVTCHGRVALLQLGLGFDPELTGLENIRHSRLLQNLSSDYEQVVDFVRDFSELGDFIKYPVKTYSSGMYSRLAFATAIAGDPDILIADEVLAVGDMNFSQKCLAKMREFKDQGKTVLLVTHDVATVKNFCDHAVWLNEGRVLATGPARLVAEDFRNFMLYGVTSSLSHPETGAADDTGLVAGASDASPSTARWTSPNKNRRTVSNGKVQILRYRFADSTFQSTVVDLEPKQPVELQINFCFAEAAEVQSFGFTIHDKNGLIALHLNSGFFRSQVMDGCAGQVMTARFLFDVPPLADGEYSISIGCWEPSGEIIEKYDYDSTIQFSHPKSSVTDRQAGYVVVSEAKFELDKDV
jgi:ABC-type polysaccharide/polyol phosphate transport system ATPase subunit